MKMCSMVEDATQYACTYGCSQAVGAQKRLRKPLTGCARLAETFIARRQHPAHVNHNKFVMTFINQIAMHAAKLSPATAMELPDIDNI